MTKAEREKERKAKSHAAYCYSEIERVLERFDLEIRADYGGEIRVGDYDFDELATFLRRERAKLRKWIRESQL